MVVESTSVTFQEEHDTRKGGCGFPVTWRRSIDLRCPELGGDFCVALQNLNEQLLATESERDASESGRVELDAQLTSVRRENASLVEALHDMEYKNEAELSNLRKRVDIDRERADCYEEQMFKMGQSMALAAPAPAFVLHGEEAVVLARTISESNLAHVRSQSVTAAFAWLDKQNFVLVPSPAGGEKISSAYDRYLVYLSTTNAEMTKEGKQGGKDA